MHPPRGVFGVPSPTLTFGAGPHPMTCKACHQEHSPLLRCEVARRQREAANLSAVPSRVVKPEKVVDVKPVKPPVAGAARSNKPTWRERDPEAYRAYMRDYMARRRAARRQSAGAG